MLAPTQNQIELFHELGQRIINDYCINNDMRGAFDRVLGAGYYDLLISAFWHTLNSKKCRDINSQP